jgi:hypothetical protein
MNRKTVGRSPSSRAGSTDAFSLKILIGEHAVKSLKLNIAKNSFGQTQIFGNHIAPGL